jgi:hypothetical protein
LLTGLHAIRSGTHSVPVGSSGGSATSTIGSG